MKRTTRRLLLAAFACAAAAAAVLGAMRNEGVSGRLAQLLGQERVVASTVPVDRSRIHYTVAETHPRILLNHQPTLERLKARLASGAPEALRFRRMVDTQMSGEAVYGFRPWFAALLYRVTGEQRYADYAVAMVDAWVAGEEALVAKGKEANAAYDSYLYVGTVVGDVALVYDWCFDRVRPDQRQRWFAYADQAVWNVWNPNEASWGGRVFRWTGWSVDNPSNNYFYSFLRATMLLGLASHGEDPQSEQWLDMFRGRKLEMQLFPTFARDLAGGGSREGTGYGVAMRTLFELYDWWEKSTGERLADRTAHTLASEAAMIHSIVPTLDGVVPTGDHSRDPTARLYDYHRGYLLALMALYPKERLSGVSRSLLEASSVPSTRNGFNYYVDYLYPPTAAPLPLDSLSTTYWAPGTGQLAMRSDWSRDAAFANLICGPNTESHAHRDQGSFVIFRREWLANDANMQSKEGLERGEAPHNLVRFERDGRTIRQRAGESACRLQALRDEPGFTYAKADAGDAYGPASGVRSATRDFLFIKPHTFVVLDRSAMDADVRAVWTLNLPGKPEIARDSLAYAGGAGGGLDVIRLAPHEAESNLVAWANQDAEIRSGYRWDERSQESGQSTFLHVLGTSGSVLGAERSDADGQIGVLLRLADGRKVAVRFGSDAQPGRIEFFAPDEKLQFQAALARAVTPVPLFAVTPR